MTITSGVAAQVQVRKDSKGSLYPLPECHSKETLVDESMRPVFVAAWRFALYLGAQLAAACS